jgi:hypothetical protein
MIQNSQTGRPSFEEHSEAPIGHAIVGYGGLAYFQHGEQLQIVIDILKRCQLTFPQCAGYR